MINSNDDRIIFSYYENNIFQNIVDKTLYAVKYMKTVEGTDDNIETYSLSHDEKEYITYHIKSAITNLKKIISEKTFNSEDLIDEQIPQMICLTIYKKLGEATAIINPNKMTILDNLNEQYIINYVLLQWGKLINIENIIKEYDNQTSYLQESIDNLLDGFTILPQITSYTIQ